MLANSPAITAIEQNHLQRLAQHIRTFLRNCWNAVLIAIRGTEILIVASPLALLTPASILSTRLFRSRIICDVTWNYTTLALQTLGPCFVKLAQWIATRRDLFPPYICDRLSKLHDDGIPHSWSHTNQMLTQAFGDYEAKGLRVDHVVGCGSAAQVYKGRLTQNGKELTVAIKVLHPQFQRMVLRDLWFMQTMAEFLHSLPIESLRMLNLPRATENFGAALERQADLRIEGENLKRFRQNFYGNAREEEQSSILFPRPLWMSKYVLIEEFVHDGVPISEYVRDNSEKGTQIRAELASPLLRGFLKMIFIDNWVHADLHPGNVLVQTTVKQKPRTFMDAFVERAATADASGDNAVKHKIVFLDAGIATTLSPEDRKNLHDLFRAVLLNEGNQAGRLMVERAKYERCSQTPGGVDEFARGIEELVAEFHDNRRQGLTLGAVRIGSLLSRVLDLCRTHGVEIDPSMASIVISTLVLEGLGRSLEPNLNLIDFAVPFVLGRGRV